MGEGVSTTTDRIIEAGRQLVTARGFNGFSYADVATAVGVRKASIHHHFPTKADLATAVVARSRALIRAQAAAIEAASPEAVDRLRGYLGFWERCIVDESAPFCLAAVLAAELPSLPPMVAEAVQGHFAELASWLAAVLALGQRQGTLALAGTPAQEADAFMAAVHGAMLAARVFGDPAKFAAITGALLRNLLRP